VKKKVLAGRSSRHGGVSGNGGAVVFEKYDVIGLGRCCGDGLFTERLMTLCNGDGNNVYNYISDIAINRR
jgi:hypothetical protein